ncbi:MAG TPA: hypothetical protein VG692_05800 [Gemmatimonadales bacterium]|nr:hypothetical protein [Gemmatimonadales bacterium]
MQSMPSRRLSLRRWADAVLITAAVTSCAAPTLREGLGPDPTDPASIAVEPRTASIAVNQTLAIRSWGRNATGDSIAVETDWTSTGGSVTAAGLFSSNAAGTFIVKGRAKKHAQLADSSVITVTATARTATAVVITPASASLTTGQSRTFTANTSYSDGSSGALAGSWSATGGTITGGGVYTAGSTPGTFRVVATEGTVADTATVTISPAAPTLTQVTISPANATVVTGGTQQFSVSGRMSDGSTVTPTVNYSATGGTITAGGLFTAGTTTGTFRVIATQQGGTLADTSTVNVTAPTATLQQVLLTPATASVAAGLTQQFAVSGLMSDGSTIVPAVTYSATGGTITAGGLYTAGGTTGTFRVIATQQGGTLADTSAITITAPVLTQVTLTPASASVVAGNTQQFSVSGRLSDGSTNTPAVNYAATGGTITAGGLYTAGSTTGTFRVIATQQGGTLADTSTVTITAPPPTLAAVVVTPATATVAVGATQQFSASGRMSDGSTGTVQVTWLATGGTITTGGLYTAGSTAGTFRVIATQQGGTLADTSTITIPTPPVLSQVILTPATATVATGATQQFSVSGRMSDGSTSSVQVNYTATGGTITAGGLYTAGSTTGSFRVIATQQGGTLADTSTVTIAAAPPPGTPIFASDWSGGILDGGKWTRWGNNGALAAVAASGLGFPTGMANVLRVTMGTGTFDWVEADNKWGMPAIGESRAFRLYVRNEVGAVSGGWAATHPVESKGTDGSISGSFYAWHIGSNTNSTFPIAFGTEAAWPRNYISTSNTTGSDVGTLQKNTTYRLEWKWTRTATSTYTLDMRITDSSGNVIEDNSTIRAWGGSTLASNNTGFPLDAASVTGMRVGINGGFSAAGTQYVYWGGFAVCADWCGAYSSF